MKHTFLFEPGKWIAQGTYSDERNNPIPVEGETVITHEQDQWLNVGSMRLVGTGAEFTNSYEIEPFEEGAEVTAWSSQNPALGRLVGKFMVVADTIISSYATEDNHVTGCECLLKIDDSTYLNRGFAFMNGRKLSSWAVELKKR